MIVEQEAAPTRDRLRRWGPAALAAGFMLLMGLWGLGRQSAMGNDESITRWAARLDLAHLRHVLSNVDAVHGSYYLLMHGWIGVVGSSPTELRVPSVVAMACAVGLLVSVGARLSGSMRTGLVAGLLTAATPAISFYAQTARSYSLVFLGVVAATAVLLAALHAEAAGRHSRRRWWLLYAVTIALAGYLNEMAALVLAAHAVTVLAARVGREARLRWLASALSACVLLAPLVVVSSGQTSAVQGLVAPGWAEVVLLWHEYFGVAAPIPQALTVLAVVALIPSRLLPLATQDADRTDRTGGVTVAQVALPLATVPALVLFLEASVATPLFDVRYVLYGQAGVSLLAASGVERLIRLATGSVRGPAVTRIAGGRLVVSLVVASLVVGAAVIVQLPDQRQVRTAQSRLFDYGGPAFSVGANAHPGDGVVFVGDFFRTVRLGYPEQFRHLDDLGQAASPARTGTLDGRDATFDVVSRRVLAHQRVWEIEGNPSRGVRSPLFLRLRGLLRSRFTAVDTRRYRHVALHLWVQRSDLDPP